MSTLRLSIGALLLCVHLFTGRALADDAPDDPAATEASPDMIDVFDGWHQAATTRLAPFRFDTSNKECTEARKRHDFADPTDPRVDGVIKDVSKNLKGLRLVSTGVSDDAGGGAADPFKHALYRGPAPNAEGIKELREKLHVKTIINLEYAFDTVIDFWTKHKLKISEAQSLAESLDMNYVAAHMPADVCEPSECLVDKIVATLQNPANYPIYIHCLLGEDRTGFVVALYRYYVEKMPAREAYYEMCARGYKSSRLPGFHCLYRELTGLPKPAYCNYFKLCEHTTGCDKSQKAISKRFKTFSQLANGVYRGGSPSSDADFAVLGSHHVKTIISSRFWPNHVKHEKELAKKHGFNMLHIRITPSPLKPGNKSVFQTLDAIGDPANQPVFFHCSYGRDRTGLLAALYRIYYHGWSPGRALDEWHKMGYPDAFFLAGLMNFLTDHSDPLEYWARNPLLAKALKYPTLDVCKNYVNGDDAREVFCKAGTGFLHSAATLVHPTVDESVPLAAHALTAPPQPEASTTCGRHGGLDETLHDAKGAEVAHVCRFADRSAIEAGEFERN